MDDSMIVGLYWKRDENAITESDRKYGRYCASIAMNIVNDHDHAEECVNDTWLNAWNSIPPAKPSLLKTFLGRITRNLSFDLVRRENRLKRGGGNISEVLDELSEIVSGADDTERVIEEREIIREIDTFLMSLPRDRRDMFILRYWYCLAISDIAARFMKSENSISVSLNRIRRKLRSYLYERGFEV